MPQVCRVYIGSFNGLKPIREDINPQCVPLFQKEQVLVLKMSDQDCQGGVIWCDNQWQCRRVPCPAGRFVDRPVRHPFAVM
jgi:hypothetical protein